MCSRVEIYLYAIYISSHRYDVQWHVAPLHIQKVILFLLQKGNKDFILNAGGLFYGSLECFATVKGINILLKYIFSKLHIYILQNTHYSW